MKVLKFQIFHFILLSGGYQFRTDESLYAKEVLRSQEILPRISIVYVSGR